MLRTRVRSAFLLAPVVGVSVWAGGWVFLVLIVFAGAMAGYEFSRLMRTGGHQTALFFTLAGIVLCFADAAFPASNVFRLGLAWLLLASIAWYVLRCAGLPGRHGDSAVPSGGDLAARFAQTRPATPTVDWALTIGGGLYVGWLMSHFVALRSLPGGLAWTALALLTTWASDSGAYFLGRAIGTHKLCPSLSPGKTWEGIGGGLIGGLVAGAMIGGLAMHWLGVVGVLPGLIVGLLVAVVAPVGDLAISMMKREVGAKDSGTLIPGHGGMLDRTDSLMFVAVIVYYVAIWVPG